MYLLLWIFAGSVVGWLAGKSLEGHGYGRSMDLVMGAGGAVAGGLIIRAAGFTGNGGTAFATFVAISCAALLTIVAALANGRTIYSRELSAGFGIFNTTLLSDDGAVDRIRTKEANDKAIRWKSYV